MTHGELAKSILIQELKKWVLAKLIAKASFFGFAIINPIVAFIVQKVIEELLDYGALAVNWTWIIVENNVELKAAIKSKDELKLILAMGGDTTKIQESFDDATDDLVKRNFDRLPR